MKPLFLAVIAALLVACAGPGAQLSEVAAPPIAALSTAPTSRPMLAQAGTEEVKVVDVAQFEAGEQMVCRRVSRPGSRIATGTDCFPRGSRQMNVETREHIQREISGQGSFGGWKSQQQIDLERAAASGIRQFGQL